jgi:aquaporin NIP
MNIPKYLAELLGTFGIVFCGTGSIIINQQTNGSISHLGIAITFGLIVMAMIYCFGHTSGAHFNPAVTLALCLSKKCHWKDFLPYICSQAIGAFLASGLLKFLFPTNELLGTTLPIGPWWQSFLLEVLLTYFLMLGILMMAFSNNKHANYTGLIVGMIVLIEALFAGPVCGASMNPIRSIAPAIVSGHTEYIWLYISAPFSGAILAIPLWKLLIKNPF